MNCKQGDIAIFVRGDFGNESPNLGKVFTCIRLASKEDKAGTMIDESDPVWVIDGLIEWKFSGLQPLVLDSQIRPLRGDLSNDEVDTETPIIKETEKC